ncbi:hypothetical protein WJX74_008427 [Apatococcus lobatus]|uniref:CENP-V/GFA domain-containing protein n=1 Tax=Apatococcus lobatus TaxID=904363 RepID=A0AAW1RQ62_9CHLO
MFSSARSRSDQTAEEETKTRPPYVEAPDAKQSFQPKYKGACYCGQVEIAANSDPVDVRVCHCRGCQRTHGASYQWSAFFHKHQVLFTKGHDHLEFYNTETRAPQHKLPVKILCKSCHAPLCDEGRRMMLIFPPVFDWKDGKMPDSFKPRCHIFYGTRTFDIEDGAPKFEGMKEKSDKLPEVEGDSDDDDASNSKQPEARSEGKQDGTTSNGDAKAKSTVTAQQDAHGARASQNGAAKQDASMSNGQSNGNAAPEDSIASDVKRQRRSS